MKLYGIVCEDGDGWYFIQAWFFSPEDRVKYMEEKETKEKWHWRYQVNYWLVEIDTSIVPYIDCRDSLNELIRETTSENLFGEDLFNDDKSLYTNGFRF